MAKFDLKSFVEGRVKETVFLWLAFYFILGILQSHGFWHLGITGIASTVGMVLYNLYKKYW